MLTRARGSEKSRQFLTKRLKTDRETVFHQSLIAAQGFWPGINELLESG